MKKIFTKLALFTFISIILAMPLQAFAEDNCIPPDAKKNFIITIVEESFGDTTSPTGEIDSKKDYQSITCCRKIKYQDDVKPLPELEKGPCGECKMEITYIEDGNPTSGIKSKSGQTCEEVMVILSKGGTTMIEGYIASIYTWAASLVGLIAVTVIIISGIQIAMSGGDTQAVDSGKNRIIKSISGLAVLFLSGLILYTINPNFFTK